MAEFMDQSVHQPDELAKISGYPVLAVIPYWETAQDIASRRQRRWALVGSIVGIIIAATAVVHYFYRPLDILWVQCMRKLNIGF